MTLAVLELNVGHVLLAEDDELDLVAGGLDHGHGVVDVARRLRVDRHDLVVLPHAVAGGLAWKIIGK